MIVYLVQMGMVLLLGAVCRPQSSMKEKRDYLILVGIMFAAVSALRHFTVGVDTLQYYEAYQRSSFVGSRYEFGFILLIRLLNFFSSNPQLLLVATSVIITCSVMYLIYKTDCNAMLASFLYVSLLTYATNMNLMRQALAISIILFTVPALMRERKLPYIAGCLVGSLFHSSAIVLLVLLPLASWTLSKRAIAVYFLITLIAAAMPSVLWELASSVFNQYGGYSNSRWAGGNYVAAPIMTILDIFLFGVSFRLKSKYGAQNNAQERVLFHGTLLQISFQLLACFVNIFQRMTTFTSLFLSLYVASAFFKIDNKEKFLLAYLICIGTGLFFIVIMTFRPEWHGVVPYSLFV